MPRQPKPAPGKPGTRPRWSSGAKTAVGTAVGTGSRIWFTIGSGTLNEIFFADIDKANTRSIRFLVTGENGFFSDEESDAHHVVKAMADGIPGYTVESECRKGQYRLTKEIVADPVRDCLLVRVRFEPRGVLRLFLLIDPQMADQGADNTAWVGEYKDIPMLFAAHGQAALAAMCSVPFLEATSGYVGRSDGLQELKAHGRLTKTYNVAQHGNVMLVAELGVASDGQTFTLAVGFGQQAAPAAQHARAGILECFDDVRARFERGWSDEQARYLNVEDAAYGKPGLYRVSTAVLQAHESKCFPGGFIASLSTPWGFAKGDKDIGGYHVVWPRDLTEIAMGKLACGDVEAARRAVFYLACTQNEKGDWSQNMWLDGTEHWGAQQMDGMALPILLADRLRRDKEAGDFDATQMVQKAATFLVRNGPSTGQDRWEVAGGFSVFTMACEVAALLAAAEFAAEAGRREEAEFLRETADAWNEAIDTYTYVRGTALARRSGVDGYYIRISPPDVVERGSMRSRRIKLPNHIFGERLRLAENVVSPDALALVRFGLRRADDPRIVNTLRVVDQTLRHELTTGPGWRRSSYDGYGEHADGAPFNGRGIGRCWPLLAGERGHYEVAAGNLAGAKELLRTMAAQSGECGMIPEQVWDVEDLPERQLFNGKATGSGMPLAWAHAEFVKLLRSVEQGEVWDLPPQTVQRYLVEERTANFQIWSECEKREWVTAGKQLRLDLIEAAEIRWAVDGAKTKVETATTERMPGIHSTLLELPKEWKTLRVEVKQGTKVRRLRLYVR